MAGLDYEYAYLLDFSPTTNNSSPRSMRPHIFYLAQDQCLKDQNKLNQYHYGYTGLAETDKEFLLPYYIKKETDNPYINLAFISN